MKPNKTPTVPQYLREREAAKGCRPNIYQQDSRRLDPHETAMAEDINRKPIQPAPLLSLDHPLIVALVLSLACLGTAVYAFGHLVMGWW